jgi:hypothetical protein
MLPQKVKTQAKEGNHTHQQQ